MAHRHTNGPAGPAGRRACVPRAPERARAALRRAQRDVCHLGLDGGGRGGQQAHAQVGSVRVAVHRSTLRFEWGGGRGSAGPNVASMGPERRRRTAPLPRPSPQRRSPAPPGPASRPPGGRPAGPASRRGRPAGPPARLPSRRHLERRSGAAPPGAPAPSARPGTACGRRSVQGGAQAESCNWWLARLVARRAGCPPRTGNACVAWAGCAPPPTKTHLTHARLTARYCDSTLCVTLASRAAERGAKPSSASASAEAAGSPVTSPSCCCGCTAAPLPPGASAAATAGADG